MDHRASCWDLQDHPCSDLDLKDLLAASEPVVGDPSWAASSGVDSPREPSPVASADPDAAAFRDAVVVPAIAAVPHVGPSGDAVDPADAAAYAAVADRVALRDLAYDAAAVVHRDPEAVEDHSCAEGHAEEGVVRGDWEAAVHAAVEDPAFAYVHPVLAAAAPEDRADEVDPAPEPYAVDPEGVPVAVDTDYAATGMERGFVTVAPLDSVPGAEA